MARLIDADKIVNGISLYMSENAYFNDTPLDALKMVSNWITEATAVEVVRCRDCKHYNEGFCAGYHAHHDIMPDDFCSYGERKDGDVV